MLTIECPRHEGAFDCTPFCDLCEGEQEYKTEKDKTEKLNPNIKSLFIEGRLWFDKVNGNTYHAVRIEANGKVLWHIPITYGYENQYLETALQFLKAHGLASLDVRSIWELREVAHIYWVSYYTPKRELWKAETVEERYTKLLYIEELKGRG